jgi:hypothetical protein
MNIHSERRLGAILLRALVLACEQRDLDVARGIEQVLGIIDQRAAAATAERRSTWQAEVAGYRMRLRELESSIRRPGRSGFVSPRPVASRQVAAHLAPDLAEPLPGDALVAR